MASIESSSEKTEERAPDSLASCVENFAREEPLKAVGAAFGAGLFLTILPLGAILVALVRIAITLLRPALLILGAIKLYEEVDRRQQE
jgi:hypothetical protein